MTNRRRNNAATTARSLAQPWSIARITVYAVLLIVPSLVALLPTVFLVNRASLIEWSHDTARPDVPETDPSTPRTEALWAMGTDSTRSFDIVAEVRPDRSVRVTETITQVFRTSRHGIERYIPFDYRDSGEHLLSDLVVSASDGTPDDVELTEASGSIRIRIGDPDTTILDAHTYHLAYTIEDIVVVDGATALVPLDAVTDWAQPIDSISYRVIGPTDATAIACFAGRDTTGDACDSLEPTSNGLIASHTSLDAYGTFTVNATYPSAAFDAVPARTARTKPVTWSVVAIVVMYSGLAGAVWCARRRASRDRIAAITGIDATFSGPMSVDLPGRRATAVPPPPPGSAVDLIPAQYADDVMPVEFVPPVNLDPACLVRIKDGAEADVRRMLAGTLVDLAADGVIELTRSGDDWLVRRLEQPPRAVKPYELTLLTALLGDDLDEKVLSSRLQRLSDVVTTYTEQVDEHLRSLQLLNETSLSVGAGSRFSSVVGKLFFLIASFIVSFFAFAIASASSDPAVPLLAQGLIVGGLVTLIGLVSGNGASRAFSTRGRGAALRGTGFGRFFADSEAIHAQAAERLGLMREYMGYAVALGCVDSWVRAMPETQLTAWAGSGMPDPLLFGALHQQPVFARSVASAFAPVRSESSGFSGGGFSGGGGGFGGGGGGSW